MTNGLERVEQLYEDRGQRARELKADGTGIIGYLCTFTPVEIITAAGLVPFRVTGSRQQSITKAGTHLESIACPFTRSVLDMALKEEYAFFDGFVMPHACDNIVTLYDLWSQNIEHSYGHFVNVPHTLSEPSMVFFEAELNTFKTSLERYTGKEISDEDLHQISSTRLPRRGPSFRGSSPAPDIAAAPQLDSRGLRRRWRPIGVRYRNRAVRPAPHPRRHPPGFRSSRRVARARSSPRASAPKGRRRALRA